MRATEDLIDTPLSRVCIEIASASNAVPPCLSFGKKQTRISLPELEAWLVFPKSREVEIYGSDGPHGHSIQHRARETVLIT